MSRRRSHLRLDDLDFRDFQLPVPHMAVPPPRPDLSQLDLSNIVLHDVRMGHNKGKRTVVNPTKPEPRK